MRGEVDHLIKKAYYPSKYNLLAKF